MTPFLFSGEKQAVESEHRRFEDAAKASKPNGYNESCDLRLSYYLYRQLPDVQRELAKRYPETWRDMSPYMLPVTRYFVNEQAKVFLAGLKFDLVDEDGQPLDDDDKRSEWWKSLRERMALAFKLKNVDRYTNLFRTCFLKVQPNGAAYLFFPQIVEVVWDPEHPFDLDWAYGVRLEIGTGRASPVLAPDGNPIPGSRRFEFFCGRPDAKTGYAIYWDDGRVESLRENGSGELAYEFQGEKRVPVVMFTAHSEELGAFTGADEGLHLFNRAMDVAVTDIHYIAALQGFGQLFVTMPHGAAASSAAPPKIVLGPSRAAPLPDGWDVKSVNGNAPLGALIDMLDKDLKRAAVLNGIPPGAVSLEARAVASGVSLQIEMRPLMEAREDAVEIYAQPMRRLWEVIRAVRDAVPQKGDPDLGDAQARWAPGEVRLPTDPTQELDNALVRIANDLQTRAEAIAQLRRVPLSEARDLAEQIAAENAQTKANLTARTRGLGPAGPAIVQVLQDQAAANRDDLGGKGAPEQVPAAPAPPVPPTGANVTAPARDALAPPGKTYGASKG